HLSAHRGSAELQGRIVIVLEPADFRMHEPAEERVDEAENPFMAAEIFREVNRLPAVRVKIIAKNARVRLPKAVNALLHVAYQEAIPGQSRRAQRGENQVL